MRRLRIAGAASSEASRSQERDRHVRRSGAFRIDAEGGLTRIEGSPIDGAFVDSVGAGDAFTAVFVLGLLRGWSQKVSMVFADAFARVICTVPGALPGSDDFYFRTGIVVGPSALGSQLAAASDLVFLAPLDSSSLEILDLSVEIAGVQPVDLPKLLPAGIVSSLPESSFAGSLHSFTETPPPRSGS